MISIEGYWTQDKTFKTRYKKPNSDYFRLDLVIRESSKGVTENINGVKQVVRTQGEDVVIDYKAYLVKRAREEGISLTKYLHRLIESDMEQNGCKPLTYKEVEWGEFDICKFCKEHGGEDCDECER